MTPLGLSTMPWRNPRTAATASGRLPSGAEHRDRALHPPAPRVVALGLPDPAHVLLAVRVRELLERGLRGAIGVQGPGELRGDVDLARRLVEVDRDLHAVPRADPRALQHVLAEHHVGA